MVKNDVEYNYFDTYAGPPPHYSKLYTFSKDTLINFNPCKRLDVSFDSINYITDLGEELHFCLKKPEPTYEGKIIKIVDPYGECIEL
jgi:hypothetical protein